MHILSHHEHMVLVGEAAVELYDVGVAQSFEERQLREELILHSILFYRRLEYLFAGVYHPCFAVST